MASLLSNGRCYSHVADGITTFRVDLFQVKLWDVKQNLIWYVRQMVFAYVLVEEWTIHPYVYCFFGSSDQVLALPAHYTEGINGGTMTSDVKLVTYWEGGLQVFTEPHDSPIYFIITLVSVDDAMFLCDGILIFGSYQEVFNGITSFTIYLYLIFSAYIFRLSLSPLTYGTTI